MKQGRRLVTAAEALECYERVYIHMRIDWNKARRLLKEYGVY